MVHPMHKLRPGVFIPVVTPFTAGNKIDFKSLERHVGNLISSRVNGIVVGGTIGEGPALRVAEKKQLIEFAVGLRRRMEKCFTIIAGTGTQKLSEAIEVAKYARAMGCEGVLAIAPNTNNQKIVEGFYRKLSKANIPILVYNIPQLSSRISPETLSRLVGRTNIVGVKDSAKDPQLLRQWKMQAPKAFVAVGEDTLIAQGISRGSADAAIPSTGNVAPRQIVSLFRQARRGGGIKKQEQVNRIISELLRTGSFRGALKEVLRARGTIRSANQRIPPKRITTYRRRQLLSRTHRR
ncbi:MAG: dihydrodipicolinate synthase family protein [Candidatus Diapherotrites archaeon]|nr:dihydrodipicolinate synthase family protein [Candidatus Diapherotrites archaeon]